MDKSLKDALVSLCLGVSVAVPTFCLTSCGNKEEVGEPELVTIYTGQSAWVENNPSGLDGVTVKYNGMTGDNQRFLLSRDRYSATNIFYPVDRKQVRFGKFILGVEFATPDSIGLTYLGQW